MAPLHTLTSLLVVSFLQELDELQGILGLIYNMKRATINFVVKKLLLFYKWLTKFVLN